MLRVRGVAVAHAVTPPPPPTYEDHLCRYMAQIRRRRMLRRAFSELRRFLWSDTNRALRHKVRGMELELAALHEGRTTLGFEDALEHISDAKEVLEKLATALDKV